MPKIKFETKVFRRSSVEMIERALAIIDYFKDLGYTWRSIENESVTEKINSLDAMLTAGMQPETD